MKKSCMILLLTSFFMFHLKAELKVSAELLTGAAMAGFPLQLEVKSNTEISSNNIKLPKLSNGRWQHNLQQKIIQGNNGVYTISHIFTIIPEREGELTIPPIKVTHNKQSVFTNAVTIKVSPPDKKQIDFSKDFFGKWVILSPKKNFYTGEEIFAELHLYILRGRKANVATIPKFSKFNQALFVDHSKEYPTPNHPLRHFAKLKESVSTIEGKYYDTVIFPFSFRILQPGTVLPQAQITLNVILPIEKSSKRRTSFFDDEDFFPDFFSARMTQTTEIHIFFQEAPSLKIIQQPIPPAGIHNLNIVGSWKLDCKLSRSIAKVGEPLELTIYGEGKNSPELLSAPKLDFSDFRTYPPEIAKENQKFSLRYALIPLAAGEKKLSTKLAYFNPYSGKYEVKEFKFTIPVSSGIIQTKPIISDNTMAVSSTVTPKAESKPIPLRQELLYQKAIPGAPVVTPLLQNHRSLMITIMLTGVIIGVFFEIHGRLKECQNPQHRRQRELQRQLTAMGKKLKHVDQPVNYLRMEMLPLIAELLELPPGATANDVAIQIHDAELSKFFQHLDIAGFAPDSTGSVKITSEIYKKIFLLIKQLSIILLLLPTVFLEAADFNQAFDEGKYQEAVDKYMQIYNPIFPQPNICYNVGNCYFHLNDYPQARLWLSRARLLAPRDQEIRENLNMINRKLNIKEVDLQNTPMELLHFCRNRLRPDEYFITIITAISLLFIIYGGRRYLNKTILITAVIICGTVFLLASTAMIIQITNDYNSNSAIILKKNCELRSLPTENSRIETTISEGSSVKIIDNRGKWIRIQTDEGDGWVTNQEIKKIFPYGVW